MRDRGSDLDGRTFDLLVVGGTVFACAVAREAAASGLRVALVAADDLAAARWGRVGTWLPERLLGQPHDAAAAAALADRELLLRRAPHLCRAVRTLVADWSGTALRGGVHRALARLAALVPTSTLPAAERMAPAAALAAWPGLASAPAAALALAFDGAFDEAGLARALARDAVAAGAVQWTHARVAAAGVDGIDLVGVRSGASARIRATATLAGEGFQTVADCFKVDVGDRLQRAAAVDFAIAAPAGPVARVAVTGAGVLELPPAEALALACWRGRDGADLDPAALAAFPVDHPAGMAPVVGERSPAIAIDEVAAAGHLHLKAPPATRALGAAASFVQRVFPGARGAQQRPIPGGDGPREPLSPLWLRLGSDAVGVRRAAAADPVAAAVVCPHGGVLAAEVDFARAVDGAVCFGDVVRRVFAPAGCRERACVARAHAAYVRGGGADDGATGVDAAMALLAPTGR